ncbi:phosphate transporter 4;1 [Actinidia rufa]|uniref:Phosphate transporter 41 n=1 Tax=Actinidia rufa TaxID=165716 RepID=A0A7J0GR62_9ERIC|nr:phosphate transporter 4;1 [Actinidia rufa]
MPIKKTRQKHNLSVISPNITITSPNPIKKIFSPPKASTNQKISLSLSRLGAERRVHRHERESASHLSPLRLPLIAQTQPSPRHFGFQKNLREVAASSSISVPDSVSISRTLRSFCDAERFGSEGIGKVWAEVKSEPYDVADSAPRSVKFEDALSDVVLGKDGEVDEELESAVPWWEEFPKRWVIVILCFSAFLLCNMDRVNMSIAILPMSQEFNWNPATVGLIQSSFFWGYLLTQVAGGIWADTVGGKRVLAFGVVWWSIATALTPIAARVGLPFLLVVRAFMGIGEGVAMPAMNNLLSKWVPVAERSRSLALVYSGMYLGSVNWPCIFTLSNTYVWVAISLLFLWFSRNSLDCSMANSPLEDPQLRPKEMKLILRNSVSKEPVKSIPWRLILSKAPVWALIVSHFCHNWGTFILLTWMPTYYNQVLKFNLTESGSYVYCPGLQWHFLQILVDGLQIHWSAKIMQSIGFLGPAFFLTQLSHVNSPAMAVLCMACSQGLAFAFCYFPIPSERALLCDYCAKLNCLENGKKIHSKTDFFMGTDAFSQSGLYSNHQDIAPRYSGVLLGLSNTAGVLAGVFGTAATGYILQHGSWDDVFKVSVGLYLVGTVVWNLFSTVLEDYISPSHMAPPHASLSSSISTPQSTPHFPSYREERESAEMASLTIFSSPALTSGRVYAATAAKSSGGSKEKGLWDWIIGGLQKEDQLVETDPILKKVEEKNGPPKTSVQVPSKKKNGGGFGGLFAKN